MKLTKLSGRIYQSIKEYDQDLRQELGSWDAQWGPLYHKSQGATEAFWVENTWLDPFILNFDSISDAAASLRSIQRNWAPILHTKFRRGTLIQKKLPSLSQKPKAFPWLLPTTPMGAWSLLDDHTLIASASCINPFPGGLPPLVENKVDPPSRAYLKLQEALTILRRWPAKEDRCLDAGASPGGWSWVLAELGAQVIAVDRAPLDERLSLRPNIGFIKHDAFTLKPEELGKMDWLFCDVVCYPPRLYEWIEKWIATGYAQNFVCTIKMQGQADQESTRRFAEIPGSRVIHLHNNKHELTWLKIDN